MTAEGSKKDRILLVEDDPNLGQLLSDYLEAKGYLVELRENGEEGYKAFKEANFDLLVLDVMMPVKDGFSLARDIRALDEHIPVIFLTAKTMQEDTLEGFRAGADDYITKPFSMEELLARVKAVLDRVGKQEEVEGEPYRFRIGSYHFDHRDRTLFRDGSTIELTSKENDLLLLLCRKKNHLLEREEALRAVWGDDSYFSGRSMDVYITRLRKYLKEDPNIRIDNVHGRGFQLTEKEEAGGQEADRGDE
ncbi:MAG: response regulator transcription factor [Flavobacteriales bacterium]